MGGSGYESLIFTAFNLRYRTQKLSEPSFLRASTIGTAHLVIASSITFLARLGFISVMANRDAVGPARYEAECNVLNWSLIRLILCFETLMILDARPTVLEFFEHFQENRFMALELGQ